MKNLAFHTLPRWKTIILSIIHTTSLIHFSLKGWENVLFELGSERVNSWREANFTLFTLTVVQLVYQHIVIAALLHPKFFARFPRIPFPETTRGFFRVRKNVSLWSQVSNIKLVYQHKVITALFAPKVFCTLPFSETIKLRMRGFPARKNSCRTCHYEVSQSIMVASARGVVVQLQTDAVKRTETFPVWDIRTAASLAAQQMWEHGGLRTIGKQKESS